MQKIPLKIFPWCRWAQEFKIETSLLHCSRNSQMPSGSTPLLDVSFQFLFPRFLQLMAEDRCLFWNPFCAQLFIVPFHAYFNVGLLFWRLSCHSLVQRIANSCRLAPRASKRFISLVFLLSPHLLSVTCQLIVNK